MPFGLHPIWAVALIVVVLILFGVGRLPQVGQAMGKTIKEFRRGVSDDQPADKKTS